MNKFSDGDEVHVPASLVGLGKDNPSAMVKCSFVRNEGKKGVVKNIPGIPDEKELDIRLIKKKLGILIIQIGDYSTENSLLEPLQTSITQYTTLLLMPEYIYSEKLRTLQELSIIWKKVCMIISHVIFIGHGKKEGFIFGQETVNTDALIETMAVDNKMGEKIQIISLCCYSGKKSIARKISNSLFCDNFIGPTETVHAANASHFYQSYMIYNMLHGYLPERAYQYARVLTPGVTKFYMWSNEKEIERPNKSALLLSS